MIIILISDTQNETQCNGLFDRKGLVLEPVISLAGFSKIH